jgi:hypothetical protein
LEKEPLERALLRRHNFREASEAAERKRWHPQ